jgi:hypothetical protein
VAGDGRRLGDLGAEPKSDIESSPPVMRRSLRLISLAIASAAFALGAQAQNAAWSNAQPVEVALSNYKFTPKTLHLRQGQAYDLRLINNAAGGHSFAAPAFFAAAQVDAADAVSIRNGKVELGPGEARDIRLIPQGMRGSIRVD